MINLILGTRAQLIKMAPVIIEMENREIPFNFILTGQHSDTMQELIHDFDIKRKPEYIYHGAEITGIASMACWFTKCLYNVLFHRNQFPYLKGDDKSIFIIHGDTFSTILGALIGKRFNGTIAHIESGLRSFNIFHPFPEEITRILTLYLTDIAFCPGDWAYDNMQKFKLERINTNQNTLIDSVYRITSDVLINPKPPQVEPYCVCSLHRFENIFNKKQFKHIISLIEYIAENYKIFFVLHPATRKNLIKYDLYERLDQNTKVELVSRMGYKKFMQLIYGASFVVTDGGSNQEELSYLNIPALLMRKATERQEGIDKNVVLCNYDKNVIEKFLNDLDTNITPKEISSPSPSPSKIIIDHLLSNLIDI